MSQTFALACPETKEYIWVGQGYGVMDVFYSGEKDTMELLGVFLKRTQGKKLILCLNEELWDDGYSEFTSQPIEMVDTTET